MIPLLSTKGVVALLIVGGWLIITGLAIWYPSPGAVAGVSGIAAAAGVVIHDLFDDPTPAPPGGGGGQQ